MRALSSLAKYLGTYDKWNNLIKKYNLKWSQRNSLDTFNKIFNSANDIDTLLKWIKDFVSNFRIRKEYRNLILFCTLTGLRPSEAIESIRLIKEENMFNRYFDSNKVLLKHYEFPDIFIRKTKKVYIS